MNTTAPCSRPHHRSAACWQWALLCLYLVTAAGGAAAREEVPPPLSDTELRELVGPVALYPDDLLAIVLPAAAYPLQIVEASRLLEAAESPGAAAPEEDWDDAVVALLNYPEALALLNEDLDWTWRLGEAFIAQEEAVLAAVTAFRETAYAAGNLHSDQHQTVSRADNAVTIAPADKQVIYVPYYQPREVLVIQSRPVVHYYPYARPVYYYPYSSSFWLESTPFWGVSTFFSLGWTTRHVHVYHHQHLHHPYFGWEYRKHRYRSHAYRRYLDRGRIEHHERPRWRSRERRHTRGHHHWNGSRPAPGPRVQQRIEAYRAGNGQRRERLAGTRDRLDREMRPAASDTPARQRIETHRTSSERRRQWIANRHRVSPGELRSAPAADIAGRRAPKDATRATRGVISRQQQRPAATGPTAAQRAAAVRATARRAAQSADRRRATGSTATLISRRHQHTRIATTRQERNLRPANGAGRRREAGANTLRPSGERRSLPQAQKRVIQGRPASNPSGGGTSPGLGRKVERR